MNYLKIQKTISLAIIINLMHTTYMSSSGIEEVDRIKEQRTIQAHTLIGESYLAPQGITAISKSCACLFALKATQEITAKISEQETSRCNFMPVHNMNVLDIAKRTLITTIKPITILDCAEHNALRQNKDLSDEEIDNKMLAERMFLLSVAGYCTLFAPPLAPGAIIGAYTFPLLASMYRINERIRFRKKYMSNPAQAKADLNSYVSKGQNIVIPMAINYIPELINR